MTPLILLASVALAGVAATAPAPPADTVLRNAYVYTVDAHDSVQQTVAIRDGKIAYVGKNSGVSPFIGPRTKIEDLHGRMLMPGLVDGHMHPLAGGSVLLGWHL